jgi:serine/threonine protein kinase
MSTDDESPVHPGDVLAQKYRVDAVLGVGGMGVVVAATHLQLEERFALKFMLPWALKDQQAVERFAREARAAVRLKSAHAARVVDVGMLESGSPFMVMEFLEGQDIAAIVDGHRQLPIDEAADYVLQACDAVAEAHSLGIVHRDLKPRNLFRVTGPDGNPLIKVLDFGISKMRGGAADLSLTKTTEVIGSPSYMSPEQLRASRDVDERTDVWALGVILYELLAGVVPFDAQTVTQLTAMVLLDPARPVRELRADVPEALEQLVARCLAKDPSSRVQSVADIADVLDTFAPEHSRGLSRRVRQVAENRAGRSIPPPSMTGGAGPRSGPVSAHASGPMSRVPVTGGTSVSWSKTELAPSASTSTSSSQKSAVAETHAPPRAEPRPRWGLVALFMLVGTGIGVGLVFLYYSRAVGTPPPAVAAASDSGSTAVANTPKSSAGQQAATSTAASAEPSVGSVPDAASGAASDVPVVSAPAKTAKPRVTPHAGREAGAAPPGSDDMPSDRR